VLRIGTLNMAHERNASPMVLKAQLDFMATIACDLWLLSEVPRTFKTVSDPGSVAFSEEMDRTHKVFAAVWAKDGIEELDLIHEAAVLVRVGGVRACIFMLPSPSYPYKDWPDPGFDREGLTTTTIGRLRTGLEGGSGDLVLGGAWSQALQGEDEISTAEGRLAVEELTSALDLQVPTGPLPHAADGAACSIDHIAVPRAWSIVSAERVVAPQIAGHARSRDHDAYVVEVDAGA